MNEVYRWLQDGKLVLLFGAIMIGLIWGLSSRRKR